MSTARAAGLPTFLRSPVCGAVALGLAVMAAAYRPEITAAVTVWSTSTAYGHCWLVLPIVAWLLWERRAVLLAWTAHPAIWPVVLTLPLAGLWLASTWLGAMEGRQLAVVGFAEVLLMAALGWRLWWALSAALLYLLFLVPFGAFVTPQLQHFTASFIVGGLRVLGVPYDADAFSITIPEGTFYVAEACAGLRFLIASIAFGVLYAVTMFRSPGRRAAFIAVSCVVPVVANGVRGLGIVLLGHALGSAEAGAADHLIYGWIFFSIVIVLLALAGLPFRQAPAPSRPSVPGTAASPRRLLLACAPVVLVAIAGPLCASVLAAAGAGAGAAVSCAKADVPVRRAAARIARIGRKRRKGLKIVPPGINSVWWKCRRCGVAGRRRSAGCAQTCQAMDRTCGEMQAKVVRR